MIPYILHVTVIVTVCFLFYKLLLQKETFYQLNRWTLLTCLAVSFALPLLPVPQGWGWTRLPRLAVIDPPISVPAPAAAKESTAAMAPNTAITPITTTTAAIDKIPTAAATRSSNPPVNSATVNPVKLPSVSHPKKTILPASPKTDELLITPVVSALIIQLQQTTGVTASSASATAMLPLILHLLFYGYLLGVVLFGINFLLQLAVLFYQSHANPVIRDGRFRIVETSGNRAPCSFANNIFINPALYDPETYRQILIHEKIHVSGRHTLDILLAEIAVVLQWFNPFVWLYRREVENNLEFLTDQSVLLHRDVERSAYQLSLLRVSAPHLPFCITNNYNQSLLKRRIVMMNSQRSPRQTIWKYFFLLPLLTILVCTLNKPVVFGQPAARAAFIGIPSSAWDTGSHPVVSPAAAATAPVTASATATVSSAHSAPAVLNHTTVLASATAAPAADADDEPITATSIQPAMATGVQPVPAVTVQAIAAPAASASALPFSGINLREGSWFLSIRDNKMEFELRSEEEDHDWETSFTVEKSEIDPFPGSGNVEFKLVREAGTMNFKGQFDGRQGFGHFQFHPDSVYFAAIEKLGIEDLDDNREHAFFQLNIKKDYIAMLQRNGYTPLREHEVISLSAMHIDEDFLKYWKGSGVAGTDQIHSLITLKAMHIDPAYVEELKAAGYDHLSVHQLVSLKAQHIDGRYIRSMGAVGSDSPITPEDLVSFKAMQIDSAYLASLRQWGYDHLTRSEIRSLYAMHVTADYIKGFRDAGFTNIPARTLVSFKSAGVTPDFVKGFRDLGYTDLELGRLLSLRSMGITPDFIKNFHKIGYDNIPVHVLTSLKASGVDADYVTKMKEKGFNSTDLSKYVRLKIDFN